MASKNETTLVVEPGKQEIFVTREFDAPRELVFRAYTDPAVFVQWFGPRFLTMRLERFEPHSGGSYRYVQTDPAGNEYGFHGVVHEVEKPERIIQTFEFEGLPEKGHVILQTTRFEALPNGRTKLTTQLLCQTVADRDGIVQSGMETGMEDTYQRLDEILAQNK